MIRKTLPRSAVLATLLLPVLATAGDAADLAPFPEAADGMQRLVIRLPEMSRDESNYSVELVAGRTLTTDGVNRLRMDASFSPKTLEGWGYAYYEVTGTGQVASTLMAPPADAPEVEQFVGGQPLSVRFNSRLPIVIFAPDGFEVRYRVWAAADEYLSAGPG